MKKILKRSSALIFLLGAVALSGCGESAEQSDDYIPTLITPTGAPTLPAYKAMISEDVKVISGRTLNLNL